MEAHTELESRNVSLLKRYGIDFGLLRPSRVGLQKAILDARIPFRGFLLRSNIHNFDLQEPGRQHKRLITAVLVRPDGQVFESTASFYRPHTKRGDPRVWFRSLPEIAGAGDLIICLKHADTLWLGNASQADLEPHLAEAGLLPGTEGCREAKDTGERTTEELLTKLKKISDKGYIPAPVAGSTSVGRLLESELGIRMNSSKAADYKGIELKAARSGSRRATMFAQVPDWSRSSYSSSSQLLKDFGYDKPDGRSLSCTVSVRSPNGQDLYLQIDRDADLLRVRRNELNPHEVVLWGLGTLRQRLAEKHAETMWVEAAVRRVKEQEHFWFHTVQHTKDPHPDQLLPLLRKGAVTVDFLIRQDSDKGYLFKISLDELDSLFDYSKRYLLA